jgi:predicted O-linked N-acetylglucosamine transferase (SPINDLY family)
MAARGQRTTKKANGNGAGGAPSGAAGDGQILALLTEGHKAHLSGNVAFAEQCYRQALKLRPNVADALHLLGVLHLQRGEADQAVELIGRAIAIDPKPQQFHTNYAAALHHAGRPEDSLRAYRDALARNPQDIEVYKNLSVLLNGQGRTEEALQCLKDGIRANPGAFRIHKLLGELYLKHSRYTEVVEHYRICAEVEPGNLGLMNDLGFVYGKLGRHQDAVDLLMPVCQAGTALPDIYNNLGNSLRQLRRLDEAESMLKKAIALDPKRWQFETNLGGVYFQQGRLNEALEIFERLHRAYPDEATPASDLATCYVRTGRSESAVPILEKIVEKWPDNVEAWIALGVAYMTFQKYDKAEKACRTALKHDPKNFFANDNLAMALKLGNKHEEANVVAHVIVSLPGYHPSRFLNAFQVFHRTCDFDAVRQLGNVEELGELVPPLALTGAIFDMMVHAATPESTRRLVQLHRKWGMAVEEQAARDPLPPLAPRPKRGKLRIGLLSSDLRSHAVGRHLMPLLRSYDRGRFEFYGYTPWDHPNDPMQVEIAGMLKAFRPLKNMRVRQIAELIRGDEIDILFDFNGHTLGSKMEAMAYRAAPIQIAWLGYPFTSGLKDMDYFLLDDRVGPTSPDLMLEKPVLMREAWVTFSEYPEAPITETLPVDVNGFITFGTLNNPYKYTPETIEAWARVMKAVPDSRMIFVRNEVGSRVMCINIAKEFGRHDIPPERLYFFDNQQQGIHYLDCYNQIDMTMDTFPVTGGVTTCDATWMGVSVVSLVGEAHHQRISYAILDRLGLGELCARTVDEYVEKSIALANSPDDLRFLRQNLRDSVRSSVFYDGPKFAGQFCDTMWDLAKRHGLV